MSVIKVTSENYEAEVLQSDKPVVIDFNATWCGPCRMLKPVIDEIAGERSDVKFVAIDVDDEGELAMEYGIMSIPCLVVVKGGKEVNRTVGYAGKEGVQKLLEGV